MDLLRRTALCSNRFVSADQVRRSSSAEPVTPIFNSAITVYRAMHLRPVISQPETEPGADDGEQTTRIQAEEIYSWPSVDSHIRSYVELRKPMYGGEWWKKPRAHVAHPEGNYSHPSRSLELINRQLPGHQPTKMFGGNWPVSKKQIVPGLAHDPRPPRQGPRSVSRRIEN